MLNGSQRHRWWLAAVLAVGSVALPARAAAPRQEPDAARSDRAASNAAPEKALDELAAQVQELEKLGRVFEAVANAVSPTVVRIQSKKTAAFMERSFIYDETGCGVVVQPAGYDAPYVLTNHHVVENARAEQLAISTSDGRLLHATRIWSDKATDVAVLAIRERDVPFARLGDSDRLAVGHWVLAIGSPFDLAGSVTHGIISGKGRRALHLGDGNVFNQDFMQTDAPINPGNSGGPLVNLRAEVVGINTAIASQSGGNEGVGFSIPINLARRIMDELLQNGLVRRGYLGIGLKPPLDAAMAAKLGLERIRGALVQDVFPGTPADQAGIERFDIIVEFNGKPVEDLDHLTNLISMTPIGQAVTLVVWRSRKKLEITARVGDRSDMAKMAETTEHPAQAVGTLGIEIQELTTEDRDRFQLGDQQGVLVTAIPPHSALGQFLEPFDVIDQVNGKPVSSVAEFNRALRGVRLESGVRVRVIRTTPQGVTRRDVTLKP